MKKLTLLFFLLTYSLGAQDTIQLKNGNKLSVIVLEISANEIKYKLTGNQNGPDYICMINETEKILYKNGIEEVFNKVEPKAVPAVVNQIDTAKLKYKNRSVYYRNRILYQKDLYKLIMAYPDSARKSSMLLSFNNMKKYKREQHRKAWLGVPYAISTFAILGLAGSNLGVQEGKDALGMAGFVSGLGIIALTQVQAHKSKMHRLEEMRNIIDVYNGNEIKPPLYFNTYHENEKLEISGNRIKYCKKHLGFNALGKLVNSYPDTLIKKALLKNLTIARRHSINSKLKLIFGIGIPVLFAGGTLIWANQQPYDPNSSVILSNPYILLGAPAALLVTAAIAIPLIISSHSNHIKSREALRDFVNLYNQ